MIASSQPPGKIKIMKALTTLIVEKEFHSITTAVIAKEAGVTEGLIYKYFKDKKALLYGVLADHFEWFYQHLKSKMTDDLSAIEKLSLISAVTIKAYSKNRVFARIILLEVRNSSEFFDHPAYEMVKMYASTVLEIIHQGQAAGEISSDVDPYALRKVIFGSIEHACLFEIIFNKPLNHSKVAKQINAIIIQGVKPR